MKVEVVSKEIIKPSIPTPHHLRTIQFSYLDQLATSDYVPFLLFYSSDHESSNPMPPPHKLKKSLSEALSHFYPIAGRIRDDVRVDCNDEGVDFVEARVDCRLVEFLDRVDIGELDKFLPCDTTVTEAEMSTKPLLTVQLNIFDCGGIGIGICFSHKLGDGVSLASFITGWAAKTREGGRAIPHVNFGFSSHFPSKNSIQAMPRRPGVQQPTIVTKRFLFDAASIAALRNLADCPNPTRVELVSAFIWWRAVAVARLEAKQPIVTAAIHAMNLRGRMVPPLSSLDFGNVARPTITPFLKGEQELEYHDLLKHVRDSISKVDGDYVKQLQCGNEGFMNLLRVELQKCCDAQLVMCNFDSWCRFPFYEANFGQGAPIWVAVSRIPSKNLIILIDTRSGDGIEAWVNMSEQDMARLECDHEFLSFVSSNKYQKSCNKKFCSSSKL